MTFAAIALSLHSRCARFATEDRFVGWLRRLAGATVLAVLAAGCGGGSDADVQAGTPAAAGQTRMVALTAASSATVADAVWTACANEHETCTFPGTRKVRYGVEGAWATRTLTGSTACSNAVFGDPAYGTLKSCAWTDPDPGAGVAFDPSQWTACASEGGACTFGGTRTVRYGTVNDATTRVVTDRIDCSNAAFGDPSFGQAKSCWVANQPVDTGAWVACAAEGQRCTFTGTRTVRYGAGAVFATGSYTGGVDCGNAVFGDPVSGTVKACSYAADATAAAPVAALTLPALTTAVVGSPVQISVQTLDASGAVVAGTASAWSVADTSIATIDAAGRVTPLRAGYTTVTASAGAQAATGALSVLGTVPIPTRSHYVGTNLAGVVYYGNNFPFVDLMKSGGGWGSRTNGTWGGAFPSAAADGTPTALAPGQQAMAAVLWDGTHYPAGRYTLLWDGEGSLSFPLSQVRIVESSPHRIVVEPQTLDVQMWIGIDSTDSSNPVRNVRFLMPGAEASYATQPFNPAYLQKIAPFSVLRFMDWGQTNGSGVREWADRSHLTDVTYGTGKGVPIETMIDLANTLHADPWFCVPHMASDDYMARFARLVHDRLDPTLHPHVEYSNEVWNTGFAQTQWASAQSDALGLARPWGTPSLFYAKRSVEMFKILQQVYGASDAGRLVRVIAGQAAWTQFSENALGYGDTAANADVLAIAPYFRAADADDTAKAATTLTLSPDRILDQMLVSIRGEVKSWMGANSALASRYRLKLKAYESGPGDTTFYFPDAQQGPMTALFAAANTSPRMKDVYTEYYGQWKALGGDAMLQYNDINLASKYGFWGALDYVYQDPATSPKYQGLLSAIATSPDLAAPAVADPQH